MSKARRAAWRLPLAFAMLPACAATSAAVHTPDAGIIGQSASHIVVLALRLARAVTELFLSERFNHIV
ncbi:hypothetical protein QF035_010362 [Streptomyces umbrinus]|uniref:Lipoprotein n=1 Tax=Streptomyces umbrinus TaxID=67370 RepID=A0ABU0TAE2_9ACTN|nr:hypothetical protein [Streptomyces umbrinus]